MKCMPQYHTCLSIADKIFSYSWNEKAYKYTIEEPPKPGDKVDKLDQYVFVVRARIG